MKIRAIIRTYGETIFISALILALTVANSWHVISRFFHTPQGKVFVGISHYHEDYYYYLSQMTQGVLGSWSVSNLYTAERIPAVPLWWPNIILGKIAAVTGLYPWTVYDIAVFLTAGVSLIALYAVSRMIFPKSSLMRVSAFVIATVTTCYYLVQKNPDGSLFINPYQYFYNYTESMNRLGGVFHLILQNILSVFVIAGSARVLSHVFASPVPRDAFRNAVFLVSAAAFLLFFINPVYVFVDVVTVCAAVIILLVIKRPRVKKLIPFIPAGLAVAIPLLVPFLLINRTFTHPFYQYFRWWETTVWPTNPIIFFYSMGPIVLFAVLGLYPFLRSFSVIRILGLVWFAVPILLYFSDIPNLLAFPKFRLHQPPQYIFLGALAAEGMMVPGLIAAKVLRRNISKLIFFLILIPYLAFQLPMMAKEIGTRNTNAALTSWLNYLDRDLIDALIWLKGQPHDRIAIGVNNVEVIIPVLSGHTVYEGHKSLTYNYREKVVTNARFFTGQMQADEARAFLSENNIGYIVWRNADGDPATLIRSYPYLKEIFRNSQATIFTSGTDN